MKRSLPLFLRIACLCLFIAALDSHAVAQSNSQQLAFAGLRAAGGKGQFNAVRSDAAGNLYLLVDQQDGVRVLKTDSSANQVLAQAHLGAHGDIGNALELDAAGNVYVTGTTTSRSLPTTSGVPFPSPADASTNSFFARFDSALNPVFVTYAGSGRMAAAGIAVTADRIFITGGIYAATLPVTASAILQSPASGSSGNGFVECFDKNGTSLLYATYLSGLNGDTNPSAIIADASNNAYVAGYTTSKSYPTLSAIVPEMIGTGSGFLTKITPAGDGFAFSTFLPGLGVTSLGLDSSNQTLLFSGSLALGQFPVATVTSPVVSADYQTVVRMSLDGNQVLSSVLLAPGSQSVVTASSDGGAWAALTLTASLLPLPAISGIGTSAAFHISAQNLIDKSIRFGGPPTEFSSIPVNISSIAVDVGGQPLFAGAAHPTTSSALLDSQIYDLPLFNRPTAVLPSTLRDAVLPPGTNCGSLCAGSGAFLAKLNLTGGVALAFSADASPNVVLRNLGSLAATDLHISATGFTATHNCPLQLGPGDECDIVLAGSGPGNLTAETSNAAVQTIALPSVNKPATTLVYSPRELDFGVIGSSGSSVARTLTVTNLGGTAKVGPLPVSFPSNGNYTTALSGDCPGSSPETPLQPGASCHLKVRVSVPSGAADNLAFQSAWSSDASSIALTGYTHLTPLSVSANEIEFGTQFVGGVRLPRYLYLSNHSDTPIQHSQVGLPPSSSFTIIDRCPSVLEPHTVCQLQIDYLSPRTSADSVTLSLDQGISALVTGRTIPRPETTGAPANPHLVVSPTSLSFLNAVAVTGTSVNVQTATISNTGTQPFPLNLEISGDFVDSTNCPSVLSGGASCSVVFTFTPSQPGARQGLLSVTTDTGTTPAYVSLSGTGTPILPANNGTLDLGSTPIGKPVVQWYKITQPLSRLTATTQGQFGVVLVEDIGYGHGQPAASSFAPSAIGSCSNCWLGVQFLPSTAGSQVASLTLNSTSSGAPYVLSLTGDGLALARLSLTPAQQDFGPIPVHSSSSTTLFTLTNLTSTTANLTVPSISGDFAIRSIVTGGPFCIGPLAPNASCFIAIAYAPQATGPSTGILTLASDAATVSAALTGFGSNDPGIGLTPDALVFRNVPSPEATQQTITLTDTGIYKLQIGTPSSNSPNFQVSTTCGTLIPGATCTVTATFLPASAMVAAQLSIPVTSAAPGNPQKSYTVPLSGAYTMEDSGLEVLPLQADYGPTATSTLGLARQFLVNNLTTRPITLTLSLPRQFTLTQPPCATLDPGGGCSFSAAFLPLTNGDVTGTILAQASPVDGNSPLHGLAYVEGFGKGTGSFVITGDILPGRLVDFHQVASGQTSTSSLTITNNGSNPITIRRITSEWPFLSSTTCGNRLSANQSCNINLTYSPLNQNAVGSVPAPFNTDSGTLIIESDAVTSPDLIDLTGTVTPVTVAVPSNTAPLVSYIASQNSLNFATTSEGNASAPQTIVLSNTGSAIVHITRLSTTPDFSVSGNCAVLIPGASCPLTVSFTPQASSSQSATPIISALEITFDSSTSLGFISLLGVTTPPTSRYRLQHWISSPSWFRSVKKP